MPAAPTTTRSGRQPLLDAAIEIVAEQSSAAVTMRAVAERAGVSPGTVSYHFASVDELLVEALEYGATQTAAMLEQLLLDLQDGDLELADWAGVFAAALAGHIKTRRAQHFACFELQLLAARRPELMPAATRIQMAYARISRAVLRAHGAPDLDAGAVRLTAMVTGLVLAELVHQQPGAEQRLAELFGGAGA